MVVEGEKCSNTKRKAPSERNVSRRRKCSNPKQTKLHRSDMLVADEKKKQQNKTQSSIGAKC